MLLILLAIWFPILVFCKILYSNGAELFEGDQCTVQSEKIQGICSPIQNCSWALTRIRQREHVDICHFIGRNPIICCPSNEKFDSDQTVLATPGQANAFQNVPIQKVSSSAWAEQKCELYYPPREGVYIVGVGGKLSLAQEFPHMAILGYGNESKKEWKCGGSLISHHHILTAAHCLYSSDLGQVRYVRLGDLDILNDTDKAEPQDFMVKSIIPHPNFDESNLKHDIAILVLDKPATITDYVKPACLHAGGDIGKNEDITATGWGITEFAGQPSSHLIKVQLKIVENSDCQLHYKKFGTRGIIDEDLQVCAGSAEAEKIIDTCDGDSGGPLQFTEYKRRIHYKIIGVTSFGKACGISRSAGVYTRISSHMPWIEMIVTNNL